MTRVWTPDEQAAIARGKATALAGFAAPVAAKPKPPDKSKDWRKAAQDQKKELQRLADEAYGKDKK